MAFSVMTQWIQLRTSGQQHCDAFLALPPSGTGPGLLLFQEIFGGNDHIQSVAQQYALDGFVVLAPDVFWRKQSRTDLGYGPDDVKMGGSIAASFGGDELIEDIRAWAGELRKRAEVTAKIGALGYCFGGRLAYLAAAEQVVDAAVAYYGGGIQNQLDRAPDISCPIILHYAGKDPHIPSQAVAEVRAALAGNDVKIHEYAHATHGFNCWARPSYDPVSAALAHGLTLQFLASTLYPIR